jgi:tRNA A37 N6-isopentenylltransferase MiaA
VLALFGPTAAGKSTVAHAVALALGGEVVVADPFQRYRGLEIASDAPTDAEMSEVRYHLVRDLDLHRPLNPLPDPYRVCLAAKPVAGEPLAKGETV